jgi:hypothetical protein
MEALRMYHHALPVAKIPTVTESMNAFPAEKKY